MARRFPHVAALEAAAGLGGGELHLEPCDLPIENRCVRGEPGASAGRVFARTRAGCRSTSACRSPTGCRAGAGVPAERPGVARERESGQRGADPHFVLFVREMSRVEAADRRRHLAAEYRHDEQRRFRRRGSRRAGSAGRRRAAAATADRRAARRGCARCRRRRRCPAATAARRPAPRGTSSSHSSSLSRNAKKRPPRGAECRCCAPGPARRCACRSTRTRGRAPRSRCAIASGAIYRPVVDDQQLEIRKRLPQHRIDRHSR